MSMRITVKELHRNMLGVINTRYGDLADLQEQLATGKRLRRPSDAPLDVSNDLLLITRLKELSQFKDNIEGSIGYMAITETAMESTNTLLQRVRELAIQASSDTLSAKERMYLNKEVEQLTTQLVALVNTKFKGDYVFNGQQTKIPPLIMEESASDTLEDYSNYRMAYFNAGGGAVGDTVQLFEGFSGRQVTDIIPGSFNISVAGVTYAENTDFTIDYEAGTMTILNAALLIDVTPGTANYDINQVAMQFDYLTRGRDVYGQAVSNRGVIEREIESGITMQVNIGLDEMTTDPVSGNTLFGTLIRFGQALVQDDQPNISAAIDEIDAVFTTVLGAQGKTGARVNRLQTTLERNESQFSQVTELQSRLEDAEMAETTSQFLLTQNVYNAALQAMAKIIQPSLVNFL
ncbi:MAG: flagellar hook-associated protein FlgL [Chitinispirillaceae bacterium]|nr:flagellar hook-associated protein FlgL [Chitinispirillaceae bacterium]